MGVVPEGVRMGVRVDSTCTMASVEPPGLIPPGRGVDRVLDATWQRPTETGQHLRQARSTVQWRIAGGLGVGSWLSPAYRAPPCPQVEQIAERAGVVTERVQEQVNLLDSATPG